MLQIKLNFLRSNKGQLSLEFALLVTVVVLSAIIVAYYLLTTSIELKNANVEMINSSSNSAEEVLSKVS